MLAYVVVSIGETGVNHLACRPVICLMTASTKNRCTIRSQPSVSCQTVLSRDASTRASWIRRNVRAPPCKDNNNHNISVTQITARSKRSSTSKMKSITCGLSMLRVLAGHLTWTLFMRISAIIYCKCLTLIPLRACAPIRIR